MLNLEGATFLGACKHVFFAVELPWATCSQIVEDEPNDSLKTAVKESSLRQENQLQRTITPSTHQDSSQSHTLRHLPLKGRMTIRSRNGTGKKKHSRKHSGDQEALGFHKVRFYLMRMSLGLSLTPAFSCHLFNPSHTFFQRGFTFLLAKGTLLVVYVWRFRGQFVVPRSKSGIAILLKWASQKNTRKDRTRRC